MPSATYMSKLLSTSSISFENRPNKRPTGVESKNSIGARKIPNSIAKCMDTVARKLPIRGTTSHGTEIRAEKVKRKNSDSVSHRVGKCSEFNNCVHIILISSRRIYFKVITKLYIKNSAKISDLIYNL